MRKMWLQLWVVAICVLLVLGLTVGYLLRDIPLLLPGEIVSVDVESDGSIIHVEDPEVLDELEVELSQALRRDPRHYVLYIDVLYINYSDGRRLPIVVYSGDLGSVYISHGWDYEAHGADRIVTKLLQRAEDSGVDQRRGEAGTESEG